MAKMYNEEFQPVKPELIDEFLSGTRVFTEAQKALIRYQIEVANNAGIREYKVHYEGPNYVLVKNGQIVGTDHDGSKFDKESTAKSLE